jgi:ferredoxin
MKTLSLSKFKGSSQALRLNKPITRSFKTHTCTTRAHRVELTHSAGKSVLEVPDDESILDVALDNGIEVPHDCKMGVCMNCAAKLVNGSVDQGAGMLSDEVKENGYVLLCCAKAKGDLAIRVIPEEELMDQVMMN